MRSSRPEDNDGFLIAISPKFIPDVGLIANFERNRAERFYISIPGPTLSYTHLYYGQEKGMFAQEGLDLQVLVVRGIIGLGQPDVKRD